MTRYIVTGGTPLRGRVKLSGAKNAGFKLMIAALLGQSPSQISNIGLISEIELAKDNIQSLGGHVENCGDHCLKVDPGEFKNWEIPHEKGEKSRSSSMYIPVLLHRFGKAVVPMPGGDKIGTRPLDRHFEGLIKMGVDISQHKTVFKFALKKGLDRLQGKEYRFEKSTHTGTETLLMAAVKAKGKTVLANCALEPEVDNLVDFLNKMGGEIKRHGRNIIIDGVEKLHGTNIKVIPDRNEAVAFGCMTLATRGDVELVNVFQDHLQSFLEKISESGGGLTINDNTLRIFYQDELQAVNVTTSPHPGFMTDWQATWTALMTQCHGESVIHETVFDNRFGYVPLLVSMGAKIDLFRPEVQNPEELYNFNLADDKPTNFHAARVHGPTPLKGSTVEIKDLRAGATMMMAGMTASGQTVINDPLDQIKRGYEDLPGKLTNLGAKIEVINPS